MSGHNVVQGCYHWGVRSRERARVVIADDHPRVLEAATTILSHTCDVVAAVGDGASALDAAARLQPDVVVLDIAMPGLDGFRTASRMRSSGSDARIVFLSNHAGEEFVLAGMSRGASAFVAKVRMNVDLPAAVGHVHEGRSFVPSAGLLPRLPRPAHRRHDLQIYSSDASLIDSTMAYFDGAFEAGYSLIAFDSNANLQAIESQLRKRGLDVEEFAANGRYTAMNNREALEAVTRDGVPNAERYAAAMDPLVDRALAASTALPRHVAMFGAIAPILCANGQFDAMSRLETIADEYAASHPLSVLCAYSTSCLGDAPADVAARVCSHHATIVHSLT
jgi:CheY-like chemotaxis protein